MAGKRGPASPFGLAQPTHRPRREPDASIAAIAAETLSATVPASSIRSSGPDVSPGVCRFRRRCEKGPLNLDDVVLIEAMYFDDGSRRIGPLPPQLGLDFVHQRTE